MKRGMLRTAGAGILLALLVGCHRQDVKSVSIRVPAMRGPECAALVLQSLQIEGVSHAEPDLERGLVQVTYNARFLALKNIEFRITAVGFEANGYPPDSQRQAQLPERCR